tara:strand:- start:2036 stop:2815 length:780 start_codon:yes stop_codon:yes gene_type:complete
MYEGADAQGIDSIFVLGNGLSRKNIDPSELQGTVIGCNACYRDFTPDVICAIDAGVIFDIVEHIGKEHYNTEFYFTHDSWNPLPAEARNNLILEEDSVTKETKHRSKEFVVISGFDEEIENTVNYIMWVPEGVTIKNMMCTQSEGGVGRNTGTAAVYVACRDFTWNDYEKVYLLGFDQQSDKYDNLYANTSHYYKSDSHGWNKSDSGSWKSTHKGWTDELLKVVREFPYLQFIWVNYRGDNFPKLPNLFSKDETEIWQA